MKDKVSIIIPLYNREDLIFETLNSLYSQTYTNWEVIVIDDGSTDNSYTNVQKEAGKDKRIKLFKRNRLPKGAPTCRNIGIENSTGKYLVFLDSDDILASYCLKERLKYFKENTKLDFLVFNGAFFENTPGDTDILWNKFTDDNDFDRFLSGDVVWQTSGPIWKKKSILRNNLFFEESAASAQDWEFHIKALQKKILYKKIDIFPDYFVRRSYKQASNAISSGHNKLEKIINRIELFKILFNNNKELSKSHKTKLFKNIYFQVFSIYLNCSFSDLKFLFKEISKIGLTNRFKVKFWHLYLKMFLAFYKIGLKKVHTIAYFISKKLLSNKDSKTGYRTRMDFEIKKI